MTDPAGPVVAYVAVGSNVEPRENIAAALGRLMRRVVVSGVSTFYRAPAVGPSGRAEAGEQDEFLNGVFELRVSCRARGLKFDVLRPIEAELGRVRSADRYAPRTIDLDVLLCGEEVVDEPDLRVPAPDIERPFVAVPLRELAPDLVLPHTRQPLSCLWGPGVAPGMVADLEYTRLLKELWQR